MEGKEKSFRKKNIIMSATAEIQSLFIELFEKNNNAQVLPATVESVQKSTCTVVFENGLKMEDVRLRAVDDENKNGLLVLPKVGSSVLVSLIGNDINSLYVLGYSIVQDCNFEIEGKFLFKNKDTDLLSLFEKILDEIIRITVPTPAGVSGVPNNSQALLGLKNEIKKLLKNGTG